MNEMETARQAAVAGAAVVTKYFDSLAEADVRSKSEGDGAHDLVSNADLESEEAVARVIRAAYPRHEIIGEESHSAAVDAEHLWIIDPLDGTNNFAHHVPHFAVSIAYYRGGQPHTGVIVNPVSGDCFAAQRGGGAWHNGQQCHVDGAGQLSESLVGVGFYYDRGQMMRSTLAAIESLFSSNIHGIRRFGTAALDLCMVGQGLFGAFFEYELSPWDFAAGRLFVEEAGGTVTDCAGRPLELHRGSVLASNGRLHEAMLRIVAEHLPENG